MKFYYKYINDQQIADSNLVSSSVVIPIFYDKELKNRAGLIRGNGNTIDGLMAIENTCIVDSGPYAGLRFGYLYVRDVNTEINVNVNILHKGTLNVNFTQIRRRYLNDFIREIKLY